MAPRTPSQRTGKPSPLAGAGGASRRRAPGERSELAARNDPSPRPASLATPLPPGERGESKRVCVAQIGAAHGLKGEVRLWSFTERPDAVAQYGALQSEDGARAFEIESLRPAKDHFIVRFRGLNDRAAADALRNLKLYVPRARLPAPEDDATFYHADLIGLEAATAGGELKGEVIAVQNFGAGDILEIRLAGGKTAMLPFNETAVPTVDLAGGRIVIDPPADWLKD
ncbi:MAG: ribosome maturation factor RimM [Pseudorhodoplanes sp.]|nr:ribosome maturation factor RimM [Pseudorhodoplanes sp.]